MREWIDLVVESQLEEAGLAKKAKDLATFAAIVGAGSHVLLHHSEEESDPQTTISAPATADAQAPRYSTQAPKTKDPRGPVASQSPREAEQLLALTMWGEARSHGPEGMRAVGHVIMNRIASKRKFGRNIKEVVWKRKAFSCWNENDPNRAAMQKIAGLPETHPSKIRYNQALDLAKKIISGESRDPTKGAIFYHTETIKPAWSPDEEPIAKIGGHNFYQDDKKA